LGRGRLAFGARGDFARDSKALRTASSTGQRGGRSRGELDPKCRGSPQEQAHVGWRRIASESQVGEGVEDTRQCHLDLEAGQDGS